MICRACTRVIFVDIALCLLLDETESTILQNFRDSTHDVAKPRPSPGTKDALQFLMTREITHMKAFPLALDSIGKKPFSIGHIPPTTKLVDQYSNDSTGVGEHGEHDARSPWNSGNGWEFVEAPAFGEVHGGNGSRAEGKMKNEHKTHFAGR